MKRKGYVSNIARTNVMLMFIRLDVFPFKLFNGVNLHGYKYILGGGKMKLKERSKPYLYPWKKIVIIIITLDVMEKIRTLKN